MIVVSGPSGAGKSTILQRALAEVRRLRFSVSHTTRPPRSGEREGIDYHFVSRSEFQRLVDDRMFLEWASVHDDCYGTARSEYDRAAGDGVDLLLDLDVQGARSVRQQFPDAVSVFIYPPSVEALRRRLLKRNTETPESVERRLGNAPGELAQYREYDYLVMNDDLESAVRRLVAIVDAERSRVRRLKPALGMTPESLGGTPR